MVHSIVLPGMTAYSFPSQPYYIQYVGLDLCPEDTVVDLDSLFFEFEEAFKIMRSQVILLLPDEML